MTLKEMPKIGDKVRFVSDRYPKFMTEGKVYGVTNCIDERFVIKDDIGDDISWRGYEYDMFELVVESAEGTSVVASQSVIDLLTNLALRLTKIEDKIGNDVLKPKEADAVANDMTTQPDSVDNVNSPQHYRHGRFETIELIEDITKKYDDGFVAYCVGNAVKYVDRAPFKHGSPSEDLRKAAWYLTRAAEHTDATTPPSA